MFGIKVDEVPPIPFGIKPHIPRGVGTPTHGVTFSKEREETEFPRTTMRVYATMSACSNEACHCVYSTHYHLVFTVKYRKALLRNDVEHSLYTISKELEERYKLEIEKMGADINHVHLLTSFHPTYSIGGTVNLYKNTTAKQLFRRHPELRKELWGGEFWTDAYYAATVGERGNWKVVEQYITSQGKKPEDVNLRLFAF